MISKPATIALAVSLLALGLAPTALAREEHRDYTTGAGVVTACEDDGTLGPLLGQNVGSACFDVEAGDSTVSVEIDDNILDPVGGAIEFERVDGSQIGDYVPFCGSTDQPVTIPDGTAQIEVLVDGPLLQLFDCPATSGGLATDGTVIATFS